MARAYAAGNRTAPPDSVLPAASPVARPARPMGYVPALDGVRALAVLGVLVYHGSTSWARGGFLGVDVFFVLSGFLISTLLLEQLGRSDRVDLKRFYAGRARRLLPALLAMMALCVVLIAVFAHDAAAQFRESALPSLLYVANWSFIADHQSYFEAVGRPPLLQHLWSLAIEEQFYLLWPLMLLVLYRWRGRSGVARAALIVALTSTLLMAVISVVTHAPGSADASRVYFGTDTHCMGLLVGAALAAVLRPGNMPRRLPAPNRLALSVLGYASLGLVVLAYLFVDERSVWLYRGGFLVFSLVVAGLIAFSVQPASLLAPLLSLGILRYIGKRSYGLYLYHWPILAVTRPDVDIPLRGAWAFAFSMALTFAVAEVSYRYLELPIRRRQWRASVQRWRAGLSPRTVAVGLVGTVAVLAISLVLVIVQPAPDGREYLGGKTSVNAAPLAPSAGPSASPKPAPVYGPVMANAPITFVGDSVTVGASENLAAVFPQATIDADIGRQPYQIFSRISERASAGQLDEGVVIQAGTNGVITEDDLRALLDGLRDRRRVVMLTSYGPNDWQRSSNAAIQDLASDYPNVRVADFAALAAGHGEYVVEDGVHLTKEGLTVFGQAIAQALVAP
ncbi:MAG: acyltransferase family protein [Candidatus Nanopelagicales bacterium]